MFFGKFGFGEILMILAVFLLLFGAKRIPEVAGSLGKGIRAFKQGVRDIDDPAADAYLDRARDGARPTARRVSEDDHARGTPKRFL